MLVEIAQSPITTPGIQPGIAGFAAVRRSLKPVRSTTARMQPFQHEHVVHVLQTPNMWIAIVWTCGRNVAYLTSLWNDQHNPRIQNKCVVCNMFRMSIWKQLLTPYGPARYGLNFIRSRANAWLQFETWISETKIIASAAC